MAAVGRRARGLWALGLALGCAAGRAEAFTFASSVSSACHEDITLGALAQTGWPGGRRAPAFTADQRARGRVDLPFRLRFPVDDPWTFALVLGVRDNDLRGHDADDLPGLASVHNDPDDQRAHCLRAPGDDGPDGDARALAACRAFMLEEVAAALGPGDAPDLDAEEPVRVALAFRGRVNLSLQSYGFHLGKALHALQDSYTHSFRAPDSGRVRHVLNFIDWSLVPDYTAGRDGHRHLSPLDDCEAPTEGARRRVAGATQASAQLLDAVRDATGGRAGRLARVASVLDRALGRETGCTEANGYCGAPELEEAAAAEGCHARPSGAKGASVMTVLVAFALAAVTRRRRGVTAAVVAALAVLGAPEAAQAQTRTVVDRTHEAPAARSGLDAMLGASMDRGAFAYRVGAHVNLGARWRLGVWAEHNPWYSLSAGRVARGTFNAMLSGAYTWRRFEGLAVQTTVFAGLSALLVDLVGADAGAVGPLLGVNLLGLRVPLGGRLALLVQPTTLMFPVPQLRGVPFYYHQYRFEVGLSWE